MTKTSYYQMKNYTRLTMIMSIFLSIFIVFEIFFGWLAASSAMNEINFNHKILIFVGFIIEMSEGIYRIQYWKE